MGGCLRRAGRRLGGAPLTEGALGTEQAVFSLPVSQVDAVGACRAGELGAIRSPW